MSFRAKREDDSTLTILAPSPVKDKRKRAKRLTCIGVLVDLLDEPVRTSK